MAIIERNAELAAAILDVLTAEANLLVASVTSGMTDLVSDLSGQRIDALVLGVRGASDYGEQVSTALLQLEAASGRAPVMIAHCTSCTSAQAALLLDAGAAGVILKGECGSSLGRLVSRCISGSVEIALPAKVAAVVRAQRTARRHA
ncbi:hypothetical protein [Nocardioides aurantiacus]|uniref:hypothetical protein n=1 Tax=Nocardioides aurantiacus TaxID=86796 RepID=UPI0011CD4220|nr:hypothetical protein [Nocardioides aurantiacus]